MTEVVRTRRIEATVEEVWAALADFAAIAHWAPNVDHSSMMTAQTDDVGAARRIQAGRTTVVERIVEWRPPSALAYEIEGLPPVIRSLVNRWTVDPADPADRPEPSGPDRPTGPAVQVTLTSTIDAGPRPPQRLAARAIGRRLGSTSDQLLTGLHRHVTADRTART